MRTLFEPNPAGASSILDSSALILSFPAPRTVTGEDVLELHVHGGSATVKAVLSAIPKASSRAVIRYAEPGEFTKRAFLNDRLDLAQVESLSDTLAAETEGQRRAAVRGSSGALGKTYETWRHQLLLARGEIEALIDFSEDQHFDESPRELLGNVRRLVRDMLRSICLHEAGSQRSELLRSGIRIALLGPPNVGKSSLMNLIVGREASIVSAEAGTTRDIVEANLDIRGFLCSFADTAGFRTRGGDSHPTGPVSPSPGQGAIGAIGAIEEEGIRRAKQKALDSDIIIALAAVEASGGDGLLHISYDPETLRLAAQAQRCLIVVNKRDAVTATATATEAARPGGAKDGLAHLVDEFKSSALGSIPGLEAAEVLTISCAEAGGNASESSLPAAPTATATAAAPVPDAEAAGSDDPGGIHALISALARCFADMTSLPGHMQDLLGVTERQRQLLVECRRHLEDFMGEAAASGADSAGETGGEPDIVLAAEHLRLAANCLARITGRGEAGDVEEVLGVIFEK